MESLPEDMKPMSRELEMKIEKSRMPELGLTTPAPRLPSYSKTQVTSQGWGFVPARVASRERPVSSGQFPFRLGPL